MKQHASLIISSTPSLRNIALSNPYLWTNQLVFTLFIYLPHLRVPSLKYENDVVLK